MKDAEKKESKLKKYWELRSKFTERTKDWVAAKKDHEAARSKLAKFEKKWSDTRITKEISDAQLQVNRLTDEITNLEAEIETAEKAVTAAGDDADAKKNAKADVKALNSKKDKKTDGKAKWEKKVTNLKDEKTKEEAEKKPAEGKKPEESKYAVAKKKLEDQVEDAAKKVTHFSEAAVWKGPGTASSAKDLVPETGGADYYTDKMNHVGLTMEYWTEQAVRVDADPQLGTQLGLPNADEHPTTPKNFFEGLTFEGFFGDHDSMKFIVSGEKTLEQVKEQLKYEVQTFGYDDEEKSLATVEEAKVADKPCLTREIGLKISEDTYNYDADNFKENLKDHAAQINGFVIGVETITMKDRNVRVNQKDGEEKEIEGKFVDAPKKAVANPDAKEGETPKMEHEKAEYPMYFINLEGMGLDVHTEAGKNARFKFYQRDGKYEAVGDMTAMSASLPKVDGTTPGSASATKPEEPSKAWMVVAIIALVILFLGGAVIAYRAYTASGSLQNTDI